MTAFNWAAKFKNATLTDINYALRDIKETLRIYRDANTPYTRKLWDEWDYLVTLKGKRLR